MCHSHSVEKADWIVVEAVSADVVSTAADVVVVCNSVVLTDVVEVVEAEVVSTAATVVLIDVAEVVEAGVVVTSVESESSFVRTTSNTQTLAYHQRRDEPRL